MPVKSLDALTELAGKKKTSRIVIAAAEDEEVLQAVQMAVRHNMITPVLVGDTGKINEIAGKINLPLRGIEMHHSPDPSDSCSMAVSMIRENKADILMKGLVKTSTFLKPILNKDHGLLVNQLLSHFALFESVYYPKIFGVTDVAVNIAPDFNEKVAIVHNAVKVFPFLGIEKPKVAVLAAVETVNPKIEATVHASMLTVMNRRNQITGCIIDGPFALDNAISFEAAAHKGITGEVAGDADLLLAPDLNSGNILYKTLNFLGGAKCAAVVLGASVPIVLTSRADSETSKLLSMALACVIGK